jgi:hypothetical protein
MTMIGPGYTKTANGNISPMRFVSLVGGSNDLAVQSSVTSVPIWGVSARGVRTAPLNPLDAGYLAVATEAFPVYGPGDDGCRLELGGTVSAGDRLTADSSGRGVATTTTGQWIGAVALINGVIGDEIPVQPIYSYEY